jgi:ATP phosphoribosyltransferase
VATGKTLRENDLTVLEDISSSTARVIANRGSYRLRHAEISALIQDMSPETARSG